MRKGMFFALVLTLSRVLLGPAFVILNLYKGSFGFNNISLFWIMLGLLIYSELSDIFDGIIARRTNQVSDLGKLLDPMADSVFRLSVFFTFTQTEVALPLILVLLLFYRDTLVSAIRNLCALNGYALAARKSGKLKAIIQAITSFIIVIFYGLNSYGKVGLEVLQGVSKYSLALCALYALGSGFEYFLANKKYIKLSLKVESKA
jgi:CDP-diacylglycerol---glycerol-3-phosphate 3-phosphatidyltransferase